MTGKEPSLTCLRNGVLIMTTEDLSGEITVTLTMKGNGKFDLEAHQMSDMELSGEFKLDIDISMTQPDMGMEMAMNGSMSGNLTITGGVEIQ